MCDSHYCSKRVKITKQVQSRISIVAVIQRTAMRCCLYWFMSQAANQTQTYQGERRANSQKVVGDCKAKQVRVLEHVEEALGLLDGCVERRPLIIAGKGAKLYDEVHHKADCVD